ncbi:hypothetical protein ACA910_001253 [Epithemia clementina (nom. ined.)]
MQKSQYQVPYDYNKHRIDTITMDNKRVWKIVAGLDWLVDLCIIVEGDNQKWKHAPESYRRGMELLGTRRNMSDKEIFNYQKDMDLFFADWVNLHGERGITNYIHLLGSGHVMEYLLHWRCLYTESQQG